MLTYAARAGNAEAAKLLIAAGADVNTRNKQGITPLHAAAAFASLEVVRILIAAGADVDAEVGSVTPDSVLGPIHV